MTDNSLIVYMFGVFSFSVYPYIILYSNAALNEYQNLGGNDIGPWKGSSKNLPGFWPIIHLYMDTQIKEKHFI